MAEKTNPDPNTKDPTSGPPNPEAGESRTPDASKEHAPSTDEAVATDFPSANAPTPEAVNPDTNPNAAGEKPTTDTAVEDTNTQTDADVPAASAEQQAEDKPAAKKPAAKAAGDKPAAKAKKEKAPAVEDKPFQEFIEQDYVPALKKAFAKEGIEDVEVNFVKGKIQIRGLSQGDDCWQVAGSWKAGQRKFNVYFPDEDISKQKAFSWATNGAKPSTLESFMIDERRVTLDLIVFYTMQRLNAQKWLARN
jgi:hypothetical protein